MLIFSLYSNFSSTFLQEMVFVMRLMTMSTQWHFFLLSVMDTSILITEFSHLNWQVSRNHKWMTWPKVDANKRLKFTRTQGKTLFFSRKNGKIIFRSLGNYLFKGFSSANTLGCYPLLGQSTGSSFSFHGDPEQFL